MSAYLITLDCGLEYIVFRTIRSLSFECVNMTVWDVS